MQEQRSGRAAKDLVQPSLDVAQLFHTDRVLGKVGMPGQRVALSLEQFTRAQTHLIRNHRIAMAVSHEYRHIAICCVCLGRQGVIQRQVRR